MTTTSARLLPLASDDARAGDPVLEDLVQFLGYRPHALLTMARKPGLLPAVLELVQVTLRGPGPVEPELRFLIACELCRVARCAYSTVHVVHAAHHVGVPWKKLEALPGWRTSPHFSPRERAALAIAAVGAPLPMADADAAFAGARDRFTEDELVEIVSFVALFGWFNRWNSLVRTELEHVPAQACAHVAWLRELRDGHKLQRH